MRAERRSTPIDELVRLDRASASNDKWQAVANFQNVLHQSAMQAAKVHDAVGCPSGSSGKRIPRRSGPLLLI
jgi:hypothetical protein